MRKPKLLPIAVLISIVIVLFVTSCEKDYNIDMPQKEKKIVINGLLNPDSTIRVNISKSLFIQDSEDANIPYINNSADVKLYEGDKFIETLTFSEKGNYCSQMKPEVGKNYKVVVTADGLPKAQCSTIIPERVEMVSLDTATIQEFDGMDYYSSEFECTIKFKDPVGKRDYYMIDASFRYIEGEMQSNSLYSTSLDADEDVYNLINTYSGAIILTDEVFDGKTAEIKVKPSLFTGYYYDYYEGSDSKVELFLSLKTISKEYYLYMKTRTLQDEVGNGPFVEPVQMYNNVENGYGILGSYNVSRKSVVLQSY